MTTELNHRETRHFNSPVEAVFDALFVHPEMEEPIAKGTLLALDTIAGQPQQPGFVQQARVQHGPFDLILIETLVSITKPEMLCIRQQPDCLQRHNPAERDIPFLESMVDDLDAVFDAEFGEHAAPTDICYRLTKTTDGTALHIDVQHSALRKVGWLAQRRWRKRVKAQLDTICQGISRRLKSN